MASKPAAAVIVTLGLCLGACTAGQAHRSVTVSSGVVPVSPLPAVGSLPSLSPGAAGLRVNFEGSGGPAVTIATADLRAADILAGPAPSSDELPVASPFSILAGPAAITAAGPVPAGGATLTWTIPTGHVDAGTNPLLASLDPTVGRWIPATASYDPATSTLTAHVAHLSVWVVFGWVSNAVKDTVLASFAQFASRTANAPASTCVRPHDLKFTDSHWGSSISACIQDRDTGSVFLKVANDRNYPVDLAWPPGASVSLVDRGDLAAKVGGLLSRYSMPRQRVVVLAPGAAATLVVPLGAGAVTTIHTGFDGEAFLTSILTVAIEESAVVDGRLQMPTGDILGALAASPCLAAVEQQIPTAGLSADQVSKITKAGLDCLRGAPGVFPDLVAILEGSTDSLAAAVRGITEQPNGDGFHTLTITRPSKGSKARA